MKTLDKITFRSPVGIDNGYTNTPQGDNDSTMELLAYDNGAFAIEWDIPSLDETILIGIWVDVRKKVIEYDGVFELPAQAVLLLYKNGFDASEVGELWSIATETIGSPEFMCHDDNENPLLFGFLGEVNKEIEREDEFACKVKIVDGYLVSADPKHDVDRLLIPRMDLLQISYSG